MSTLYKTVLKVSEGYNESSERVIYSKTKPTIMLLGTEQWSSHIHIEFDSRFITVKAQAVERIDTIQEEGIDF